MTTFRHKKTTLDTNQAFLNNYKSPKEAIDVFMNIVLKEFSIEILGTEKGKKCPTFNEYIEHNMYYDISNYANITDYDNCVKCLLMNTARIKETENPDIKQEIRSVNNLLACLATYCKDCPIGIQAKDFL
tara:strand:+ start:1195 stop:1584 length:390 start_codon:yes stop_codon:yes gene_type:complete